MRAIRFSILFCCISLAFIFVGCEKNTDPVTDNGENPGPAYELPANMNTFDELVNDVRSKGCYCGNTWNAPATGLVESNLLEQVALGHSADMQQNDYFGHIDGLGRDGAGRLETVNYEWLAWGENIAMGYPTERMVFEAWLESPSHCVNLMSPHFSEYGLGRTGEYWTLMMGRPF